MACAPLFFSLVIRELGTWRRIVGRVGLPWYLGGPICNLALSLLLNYMIWGKLFEHYELPVLLCKEFLPLK